MIYLSNIAISGTDETQYVYFTCVGSIESLEQLVEIVKDRDFAITFDECTNIKNVDSLDVYDHDYLLTVNEIINATAHMGTITSITQDVPNQDEDPIKKATYVAEIMLEVKGVIPVYHS